MLQTLNQGQGRIPRAATPEQAGFDFAGLEVWRPFTFMLALTKDQKFGLDRLKRRLQALVDGHEFETLNPFASQYEGRKMKRIQCSQ